MEKGRRRGAAALASRGGRGGRRPPPRVSQSAGLLGRPAAPLGGPRLPPGASAPGPAEAEAAAACVPSAAHPWPRATRFAGPRLGSSVLPAAAASRLLRGPGARPASRGRAPHRGPGWKYAGCSGHLKTSPQREDGGGDWPSAAGCAAGRGGGERAGSARGLSHRSSDPLPAPTRGARPARESPEEPGLWESLGVLQEEEEEEGLDGKGHPCSRSRPDDPLRGDANGGAVMQQAACGAAGRTWGGGGGNESRCRQVGAVEPGR